MVSYKSSYKNIFPGGLAQLGERLPCKQEVTSSTLVFSTWQKQRSADAVTIKYSSLAQSVEHSAVNRSVVGSSPTGGAHKARKFNVYGFYLFPRAMSQADMLACPSGARVQDHRSWTLKQAPWGQNKPSAEKSRHLIVNQKMNRNCVGYSNQLSNQ